MSDPAEPPPLPTSRANARAWAERAAWATLAVVVAWPAHWLEYYLPGRSAVAVVGAAFLVLLALRSTTRLRVRWRSFAAGAVAFGAVVVIRPWLDPDIAGGHLWCRFEADAWREASGTRSETRLWMIDDYLASHSPVGRPLAEIDSLLGKDDLNGYEHLGTREWWLGSERGMIRIDSETLVVEADDRGTVTKAYIYRD